MSVTMATFVAVTSTSPSPTARKVSTPFRFTMISPGTIMRDQRDVLGVHAHLALDAREA